MRFIIFVIDGPGNPAKPNEMEAIDAFNNKLQSNKNWITADGIANSSKAKLIDNRDGKNETIPGSLMTGDQNYSGYWIIQATSEDEAFELAHEGSMACNRRVELRPSLGNN